MNHRVLASLAFLLSTAIAGISGTPPQDALHVLSPITLCTLTIFPVVGGTDYDDSQLLTLDEGIKADGVIITEQDEPRGLVRCGPAPCGNSAEVNQLVLIIIPIARCCCWQARLLPAAGRTASSVTTAWCPLDRTPSTSPCFVSSPAAGSHTASSSAA